MHILCHILTLKHECSHTFYSYLLALLVPMLYLIFSVCVCGLRSSVTRQNSVLRLPGKIGYRHPYTPGSTLSHTADRETEMRQS